MKDDYLNLPEVHSILSKRSNTGVVIISHEDISSYVKITNLWNSLFSLKDIKSEVIYVTNLILMNYPRDLVKQELLDREFFNFLQSIDFYPHMGNKFQLSNITSLIDQLNLSIRESGITKKIYYNDRQLEVYRTILSKKNLVLNAPTSYGKTLITIDAVMEMIIQRGVKNILCIVPTKALINEYKFIIQSKLDNLRIREYNIFESPYIESADSNINFFIYTQERALIYFDRFRASKIDILIIDEAQNITTINKSRSIMLLKIMELFKNQQIILLSPFVKNYNKNIINELFDNLNMQEITITSNEALVSNNKFLIDLLPNEDYVKVKDLTFGINRLGSNRADKTIKKYNFLKSFDDLNKDMFKYTLNFIEDLIKYDQKNIYFISNKNKTITYPNYLIKNVDYFQTMVIKCETNRLKALKKHLKENIHEKFSLVDLLTKGVSYHNAYLDTYSKRQIEILYMTGEINNLFTTTTISQGVNLSADNLLLFINKLTSNNQEVDFKNILGRASRLTKNSLANLFLIKKTEKFKYEDMFNKSAENYNIELSYKGVNKIKFDEDSLAFKTYLADDSIKSKFKTGYLSKIISDNKNIIIDNSIIPISKYNNQDYFIGAENVSQIEDKISNLDDITIRKFIKFYKCFEDTLEFIEWLSVAYEWENKYGKTRDKKRMLHVKFIATIITKLIQGKTIRDLINSEIRENKPLYVDNENMTFKSYYDDKFQIFDENNSLHIDIMVINTLFEVQTLIEFEVKKYIQDFYYRVNKNNDRYLDWNLTNFIDFTTIDSRKIKLIQAGVVDTFAINKICQDILFKEELSRDNISLEQIRQIIIYNYGEEDPLYFAIDDHIRK